MKASVVMLFITLALALYALHSYRTGGNRLDLFYAVAMLPWSILLAISLLAERGWLAQDGKQVTRLIYQITILGLAAFLLDSVDGLRRPQAGALIVQTALGMTLVALPMLGLALPDFLMHGWAYVNTAFAAVLLLRLVQLVWRDATPEGWMVLLVTILGLGVIVGDVRATAMGVADPSASDYFCAAALLVLWLIMTRRIGTQAWKRVRSAKEPARKQLAQDLHDGVGSHLASIIAALETGTPQQRATAMSLQHCLLELKLLVDGEGQDGSVVEHLACLRYRLQPLLQSAGIQMSWHIEDEDVLEHLHGDAARQVLRVAQEALANVVRHSCANEVAVTCGYVKTQRALLLEIIDNGIGLPQGFKMNGMQTQPASNGRGGKGLSGMDRRARRLGGRLIIEPAKGHGTRVRLQLPL